MADLDFGDGLPVLMTEKDAVKCRGMIDRECWYVPVTAQLPVSFIDKVVARIGNPS
jgi:tetraacyldisaccharide 4'-kinase